LPQNQIAKYNFVSKKALAFLQDNEYEPSIEELMEATRLSEHEIQNTMMVATRARSLDEVVPNSEELTLVDTLRNNETEATDLHVMHESLQKDIRRALKMLGDRTAEILTAYFGLDGPDGQTIEQVMSKYDLTKERIRQIKERAIGRLRKSSQAPRLKAYLG
jgi:RNA polymerase primary sigma factor